MKTDLTPLEVILTTTYKDQMIWFLRNNPEHFGEALELSISDKQPFAWRSAWLLWSVMEENDPRIRGYINIMLDKIPEKKDGHQRDLIRILQNMNLNDDEEGRLFDICMGLWESINKRPSVRYMAFLFILKTARKYPDLKGELEYITQERYLESLSPGVKHSINKMISKQKNL